MHHPPPSGPLPPGAAPCKVRRSVRRAAGGWRLRLAGSALALACGGGSLAAEPAAAGDAPLWELGAVAVGFSQQAYPGSDQQIQRALALPFFVYRGRFLRADQDTAGLRAVKTDRFELDVGVAGAFGSNSEAIEARQGMKRLGTLVELGPRARWTLARSPDAGVWRAELPLRGVFDLDDRLAARGLALEPEINWTRRTPGQGSWSFSAGAILADARLADTFYRVDAADARLGRPAYDARAGLVAWRLGASFSRSLHADWQIFGFARLDSVAGAANAASPLVRQREGASVGLGLAYTGLRSSRRASD